ncbi:MAG: CRISPR-associated RAMP protein Csx10 [Cyanobacteria bacterium J06623_5]
MKRIDLTIAAQSPLAIGQRKPGGSVSEALDYIPGTIIRGAIAKQILQRADSEPEPGDEFSRLFLENKAAIFCNGYSTICEAATSTGEKTYQDMSGPVRVLPSTALSNKTHSGFKSADDHKKTGVFDSLIDGYCAREHDHFYTPNDINGELVDTFSAYYSKKGDQYHQHEISKRLLTRVGINRRRAVAQDEILYSVEVIEETSGKKLHRKASKATDESNPTNTKFKSTIIIPESDDLAASLLTFLQTHCTHLRIGGSASRGLGKVQVTASALQDHTVTALDQRVEAFNQLLKSRWRFWDALGSRPDPTESKLFFSLTFQADAILTDRWRRTVVITPDMLAPSLGIEAKQIEMHMASSSHEYRSGWNAAWGLKKDTALVTKRGSVMLYSVPKQLKENVLSKLATLEQTGIGERCCEGYGQLRICDEFHKVMREAPV